MNRYAGPDPFYLRGSAHSGLPLRFPPALEFEFVFSRLAHTLPLLRSSCLFALLLYPAFLAYDAATARHYLFQWSVQLSFVLSTASALLLLAASYRPGLYRFLPQLVPASLGANGLCLVICVLSLQRQGVYFPYEVLLLNQLYAFFLCGILFRWALPLAALTTLSWWITGLWFGGLDDFGTRGLVLLGVTALGAATCFFNERAERSAWQRSRRLDQAETRDPLTGLANARLLQAHGERASRLGRREAVPLALLKLSVRFAADDPPSLRTAALHSVAAQLDAAGRRPMDLAARLDEDHLALLLYGCDGLGSYGLARQLMARIDAACRAADLPSLPRIHIGIAYSTPVAPSSLDQLTATSDRALAQALGDQLAIVLG